MELLFELYGIAVSHATNIEKIQADILKQQELLRSYGEENSDNALLEHFVSVLKKNRNKLN